MNTRIPFHPVIPIKVNEQTFARSEQRLDGACAPPTPTRAAPRRT